MVVELWHGAYVMYDMSLRYFTHQEVRPLNPSLNNNKPITRGYISIKTFYIFGK